MVTLVSLCALDTEKSVGTAYALMLTETLSIRFASGEEFSLMARSNNRSGCLCCIIRFLLLSLVGVQFFALNGAAAFMQQRRSASEMGMERPHWQQHYT